jgi:uncharacterized protein YjcR
MSKDKRPQIRNFYANTQQIADRFNVSIKTIKSWIKNIGLPVIQKTKNSPYMVFEEDIKNKWLPLIKEYFEKNKKRKE